MNLDPVEMVFYSATAVLTGVWLSAFLFMFNTLRRARATEPTDVLALDTAPPGNLLVGTAEVSGQPAVLAAKAAALLAGDAAPLPVKVLEQTSNRVVFEALPGVSNRSIRVSIGGMQVGQWSAPPAGGGGFLFTRGELRLTRAAQDRTRIDYTIALRPRTAMLVLGWLFVALGLAALVIGFVLIQSLVLSAANQAVRWQSVQIVQAVHFLWPPFLFGGLYRAARNSVRAVFDGLVHNLPYTSEA